VSKIFPNESLIREERSHSELTQLLEGLKTGDEAARDRFWAMVYDRLCQMAHRHLRGERFGQTMRTGTLVHEVYLRFSKSGRLPCRDHREFFGLAARLMRQILVDAARSRCAEKHGKNPIQVTLENGAHAIPMRTPHLVRLDESLDDLAQFDERLSQVVELRYFGGYTIDETAEVLDVSPDTVKRRWQRARIYLYQALTDAEGAADGSETLERD
jgi:RNA polymerase sigma-70 factor (ECF subfamily)